MKLLKGLFAAATVVATAIAARTFIDKYKFGFYYIDRNDLQDILDMEADQMDLRGTPTHECICGSRFFDVPVSFDNFEIATYYLDMRCVDCGSIYTAPTPLDREKME